MNDRIDATDMADDLASLRRYIEGAAASLLVAVESLELPHGSVEAASENLSNAESDLFRALVWLRFAEQKVERAQREANEAEVRQ